jgi:hypothetical protein
MARHVIIRAETLAQATNKSESIQRGIVFWLAIMVASIFAIVSPDLRADSLVFPVAVGGFIVSVASIVLSALRVWHLKALIPDDNEYESSDDEPTDDEGDASDRLTFEQWQRLHAELDTRNQQMEAVEGNTIRLGKVKLDSGTWGDLADVLYSHGWRWRRDIVAEAGVFRSLSGRFPAITAEMINIKFIEGRPRKQTITSRGRHWFVEQSPNLFLEHVRI